MPVVILSGVLLLFYSTRALGHSPLSNGGQAQLAALVSAVLPAILWLMYVISALRLSPGRWRGLAFHSAAALSWLAVLGPLDGWAETSAAAHMAQHMLFMMVIAPLWVLAQPLSQLTAGGGRLIPLLARPTMGLAARPMMSVWLHGAVIWFWHLPFFYVLALENPWSHVVEHACFLISAGLFWWAVLRSSQRNTPLGAVGDTAHSGSHRVLGAILTFARAPLYVAGRGLEDQQLAGLMMWVVGGIPYLAAAV